MVTGTHPEDIDLFDYVEGDLAAERRNALEVHLASCAECADHVARMQSGKDALRASQFLELPPRRRDAIFMNLPTRPRERGRSPALSPKRLLAVLTPIVAVAAIVVALSTNTGDGSQGSAAGGGGNASVTGGAADAEASPRGFLSVSGPADDVAARLRSRGIDARAVGTTVEVRHASRDQVRAALAARRKGRVQVIIVHK